MGMACRLFDLPLELLDNILKHALEPSPLDDPYDNRFTQPVRAAAISCTCRLFRDRISCILKTSCIWIRVGSDVQQVHDGFRNRTQNRMLPMLPSRYRHTLKQGALLPTVDLILSSSVVPIADEHTVWIPKTSVILPWSHRSWLTIIELLPSFVESFAGIGASRITLQCDTDVDPIRSILKLYVLPAFLTLRTKKRINRSGKALLDTLKTIPNDQIETATEIRGSKKIFDVMNAIYRRIAFFEAEGNVEDAGLIAAFSHDQAFRVILHLVHLPPSQTGLHSDEHVHRLEASRLFIEIEYRAFLLLRRLYRRWGVSWIVRHNNERKILDTMFAGSTRLAYRWYVPFMLRHKERSKFHLFVADTIETRLRVRYSIELEQDDAELRAQDEGWSRRMSEADRHRRTSYRLWAGSQERLAYSSNNWKTPDTQIVDQCYVELHNVGNTGYFWAGDKGMFMVLEEGGRPSWLASLPYAQQAAIVVRGLFNDFTDVEPGAEVQYCGQSCNCIVF